MTKLLENIYRCVNIALVNELKVLSLRMGVDIWEVIDAASTKPFGFHPFYPGPGLGGHCIPIDPFYLSAGRPRSTTSTPASSSSPARSTRPCPSLSSSRSAKRPQRPAEKAVNGSQNPHARHELQKGHRRPPRVTLPSPSSSFCAHEGADVRLQRPLPPQGWPRTPLQPQHDLHPTRQPRPVRLRSHRHRSQRLRLCKQIVRRLQARRRLPQRHQGYRRSSSHPLLRINQRNLEESHGTAQAVPLRFPQTCCGLISETVQKRITR